MSSKHAPIAPNLDQFLGTTSTPSWLWGVAYAQQHWEQNHYHPLLTKTHMAAPYIEVAPRDLFAQPIMPPYARQSKNETHHIVHITNNRGGWGKGFTGVMSRAIGRGPEQEWRNSKGFHVLGFVLETTSECYPHLPPHWHSIYHCCAQDGYKSSTNPCPFDMQAFTACLATIADCIHDVHEFGQPVIHMPRVGAGLGGGDWREIRAVIQRMLCEQAIPVIVYGLES